MIEVGAEAPDFALTDQDGKQVTLEDLRGRRTVLVFYPLDFSPVCTDQLNVYNEVLADLEAAGVQLYGVSVDSAYAHKAFQRDLSRQDCRKLRLSFFDYLGDRLGLNTGQPKIPPLATLVTQA